MTPLFRVRHLGKTYGNGVQALKDVNFEVAPGEFLVIIGLSGSGKSTLLRSLNRLTEVTTGEIEFGGRDVRRLRGQSVLDHRRDVAMIFQHFNLVARHSALKNVLMGRLNKMTLSASLLGLFSAQDRAEAFRYLELVGLKDKLNIRVDQLSGGQQQRVAIARALCQQPKVVLADEPVASLDPATCHSVMRYLQKINRELGITVLCNLHFLSLAREYATRILALRDGEIVFSGKPADITPERFREIYGQDAKELDFA